MFDSARFIELPRVIKDMLPTRKTEQSDQQFGKKEALERFTLVATAGPEGQIPAATYGEGSTAVLSKFPPGTIFREEFTDEGKTRFNWWCVGEFDKEKKLLSLFDASDFNSDIGMHITQEQIPRLGIVLRQVLAETKHGEVEYEVGEQGGILVDVWLRQRPAYKTSSFWQDLPEKRQTVKIDLIKYGTPVKERKEERVPGLTQLEPAKQDMRV